MAKSAPKRQPAKRQQTTVAVACQGGGMHAAFEVGVLAQILRDAGQNRFDLVGLSGTSAGALKCADRLVWACSKNGSPGSKLMRSRTLMISGRASLPARTLHLI